MKKFLQESFGGLDTFYYFRNLFFAAIISIAIYSLTIGANFEPGSIVLLLILSLIYPYSRFIYEATINFIVGENVFYVNGLILLATKLITMLFCFFFSWILAPIGLLFLYFYHRKNRTFDGDNQE